MDNVESWCWFMTYIILDSSFKHLDIHGHQSGNDGWCRIMFFCFHGCYSARGDTSWGFNNRQRCLPPTRPYLMFIEHQHHFCWIPSLAYTLPILPHYIPMFCENPFDQCSNPFPVHPSQKYFEIGFAQFHNSEFGDCLYGMNCVTLSKMELPNSFQDPGACLTAAAVELKCSLWINYNDCPDITKISG